MRHVSWNKVGRRDFQVIQVWFVRLSGGRWRSGRVLNDREVGTMTAPSTTRRACQSPATPRHSTHVA